ncbi:GNAT family N-acetyltransferase [Streptomyces sp. ISL-36]|uniref:GNAT family N-acetyltransferase n=1 Tax=Streptomyces sp. ISL-36 TaxID=2819182 RepID=UPI001BE73566|nr:GNAT family N-acetyltransferase [Streptomyces sp. ISL-36]MBT2441682.1 GNAT family N-acetyltransferase [Streptomyces sp. ISL-36]
MDTHAAPVRLEPWSEGDFDLLRAMNAPALMVHLGGPESDEALAKRHRRYVDLSAARTGAGRMFRIVSLPEEIPAGSVGFWRQTWDGEPVYETGWTVLPGFQGRGLATAATRAVAELARAEHMYRFLHAFPSADNGPSNAVCRKAGFELLGERVVDYPPGHPLRCNDWRLDLDPDRAQDGLL